MRFPTGPTCLLIPVLMDTTAGLFYFCCTLLLKTEFGLDDQTVGFIIGTGAIGYTLSTLYCSRISDRLGPEWCIRLGTAIVCANNVFLLFANNVWVFVIGILWAGLGHAFFWPGFQAWISRNVNRNETALRIGLYSVGWSFGLCAVAPFVGGISLEIANRLPYLIAAIIAGGVFLIFQFLKPTLAEHETHDIQFDEGQVSVPIRRQFLFSSRLANFMATLLIIGLRVYFPLLAVEWAMSESTIGFILSVGGVTQSLTFLILVFTQRWHYRFGFLLLAQFIGLLGVLALAAGGSYWLGDHPTDYQKYLVAVPALLAAGIMNGITFYSSAFYGLFGEAEKGKNAALNEAIIGLANIVPLYGGSLAILAFGLMAPYWSGAFLVGGAIVYQWFGVRPGLVKGQG
ncbi:MAG: MFS transporter [Candidatus Omnitrophica bacterium]|nr:MFS transporter [Candidatus Omnitrophota bacterium]